MSAYALPETRLTALGTITHQLLLLREEVSQTTFSDRAPFFCELYFTWIAAAVNRRAIGRTTVAVRALHFFEFYLASIAAANRRANGKTIVFVRASFF